MNSKEQKFKQTEIGLIPEEWEVKSISQISNPVRGGSPRPAGSPKYFNGNYIPWLTVASLTNIPQSQLYVDTTESYLTKEGSFFSRTLEKDTLIISNSGATLGVAKLLAIKCCANDGIAALLEVDKNVDKLYLVYFINSQTKILREAIATGNGQPNLNTELIGDILIPNPPTKAEQTAIATALSDADGYIAHLEKLIAKKRLLKQGAMQELLKPKEGWVVKRLGEVAEIYRGGSPRPIEAFLTTDPNGINWIKIGDVGKSAKFINTTDEKIKPEGASYSRLVKEGDFLLSNSMSFGRPYILKTQGCIHDGWLVIQNYQNDFDREYLYYVLGSEFVLTQYKSMASGSSVLNLNKEVVKNVLIDCPQTLEEQTRISSILGQMDSEIESLEGQLDKAQSLKQGMMQQLLTGKIRLV